MSPHAKKQFNTSVGGLFMGLGALAWLIAVVFALKPSDQKRLPPVSLAPSVDLTTCRTAVNQLYGFTSRMEKGSLVLTTQDIGNPQKVLNDATAAIALCKMELAEFCMGTGCPEQGMTMTLAQPENQRRPVLGPAGLATASADLSDKKQAAPIPAKKR